MVNLQVTSCYYYNVVESLILPNASLYFTPESWIYDYICEIKLQTQLRSKRTHYTVANSISWNQIQTDAQINKQLNLNQ